MKRALQILAVLALLVCIWAPVQHFRGEISNADYKQLFLLGTIAWFLFATAALATKPK